MLGLVQAPPLLHDLQGAAELAAEEAGRPERMERLQRVLRTFKPPGQNVKLFGELQRAIQAGATVVDPPSPPLRAETVLGISDFGSEFQGAKLGSLGVLRSETQRAP